MNNTLLDDHLSRIEPTNGHRAETTGELLELIEQRNIEFLDLKFIDLPGLWQNITVHVDQFDEQLFANGVGFDGSSIRGFQRIQESDMLIKPDPSTAFIDPFMDDPTLSFICDIKDPIQQAPYSRDPRHVAKKAETHLRRTGIASTCYFGPEAEFFVFDDVRYEQTVNRAFYQVDSDEGAWNSARKENPNLGHKPGIKGGYFPVPPTDTQQNLRAKMVKVMRSMGVTAEIHHHEVATAGQAEIDIHYDTLVNTADTLMKYKYVVKNVAQRHDKTATFMPKPLFEENGTGMHTHQSLWKQGENLFYDGKGEYAKLSDKCRWYIGGLLAHAPAVLAFAAPTTNSYKRLVPGYEAPVNLVYSKSNRSACIRIPAYSDSPEAKRLEFRPADPTCNPYLCFAACLMAGLDGIENEIEPPDPIDEDIYELSPEELSKIASTPGSLKEAMDALERNHSFLLKDGVFTEDLIRTWIAFKRSEEIDPVRLRPHPWEFALYFNL